MSIEKELEVYMDKTDWIYEVGAAADGNRVYPSVVSLKKYNSCHEQCGIVKVKVSYVETVEPGQTLKEELIDLRADDYPEKQVIHLEKRRKELQNWLKHTEKCLAEFKDKLSK